MQGSSVTETPMELSVSGLGETREWLSMPPFLKKVVQMVEDSETDWIISWTLTRDSFIVHDLNAFSTLILPHYFKHSNFSTFFRQLNHYGFRKIGVDRLEFEHKQGMKHLFNSYKRRQEKRSVEDDDAHSPTTLELQAQLDILTKDKDDMQSDVTKLREQVRCLLDRITRAKERLSRVESRQQQILAFLSNKKRKLDDGQLEKTLAPQSTQDLPVDGNNVAKGEDLPTKLTKVLLEFDSRLTNPSQLDVWIQSIFP